MPPIRAAFQLVAKVCFFKKSACSQSLSPNPFPLERGYITGATAPRPCRGLRPKARMLWLLAKSFARCKTNRASNKRHPFLYNQEVYRQSDAAHQGGISACSKSMFVYKMKHCTVQFISPRTPLVSA